MAMRLLFPMVKRMCNRGFTLIESIVTLCLISFLFLLTSMKLPQSDNLDVEVNIIKELLLQTQLDAILTHQEKRFQFQTQALCIESACHTYTASITSDTFSMRYYEDGTISQAKKICFYKANQQRCLYMQLGSGHIDIR